MRTAPIAFLLAAMAAPALAQYKCVAADGAVTFQGTPCFGFAKGEKLEVHPNGVPIAASRPASAVAAAPASAASSGATARTEASVDKRMLAHYEKQNQREQYVKAIQAVEDEAADHARQKAAEVVAARKNLGGDAAALDTALAAINTHYQTLADLDSSRLNSARAALANWERSQ